MNKKQNDVRDADIAQAEKALRRAAERARKIAQQTGTPLVIYENGQVVRTPVVREKSPEE